MTLTKNERLDRLPFTHKHSRMLIGSSIGWALDAMDVGLISFVMVALTVQWGLSPTETSLLGSVGFLGMAIGASVGGILADKFGRRQVFAITLLIYGIATGASALVSSLLALMIFRFVVGLGLGAELPVASTLVSEFSPHKIRGRVVVILEGFWAIGWILAACIGTFVVAGSDDGWRWALALGIIPAAYSLVIRLGLPESVRFLESRGRDNEAEKIVQSFEQSPAQFRRLYRNTPSVAPIESSKEKEAPSAAVSSIWHSSFRKRTLALWAIWFCLNLSYYGAFTWIPSLLHAQGFTLVKSFTFTLIMTLAQIPGYAMAAFLIERWGRRYTLATFLLGSALAAIFYGIAWNETSIILAGCLLSFFNLGAWGALYAIGPELYPTSLRGRGTGAAASFGRIALIAAPLIVPPMMLVGGLGFLFSIFAAAFLLAALAAFTLPELKGKALMD